MTEPEEFTMPLPPPFQPPHGLGLHDRVLFLRSDADETGVREHEDIMLRRVPRETAMRFRAGAGGRALTHAQYLAGLVALHTRVRELADEGDAKLAAELEGLGLQTVLV